MFRVIISIMILASHLAVGQSFGQNKVQYRNFNWSFITTSHFNIYYYGNGLDLAQFTAEKVKKLMSKYQSTYAGRYENVYP